MRQDISCKGTKQSLQYELITISLHTVHLLYSPFFQYGKKNCQSGYSAYRVNIWGLLDPVRNKAENCNLTDQQLPKPLEDMPQYCMWERFSFRSPWNDPSISRYIDFFCSHNQCHIYTTEVFLQMNTIYKSPWNAHPLLKVHDIVVSTWLQTSIFHKQCQNQTLSHILQKMGP